MLSVKPYLDEFLTAYVECALWSSTDEYGFPLDRKFSVSDFEQFAPELQAQILADCEKFFADNEIDCMTHEGQSRAGHDFWLTRNRHGSGFWDGDWEEPQATLLTTAAHDFGEFDLYTGDDGKLHGTPYRQVERGEAQCVTN